jgi:hypothetical protein
MQECLRPVPVQGYVGIAFQQPIIRSQRKDPEAAASWAAFTDAWNTRFAGANAAAFLE